MPAVKSFITMKVCIFVDGENFRYSIVNLFKYPPFIFKQEEYLPHANWSNLFDWIVNQVIQNGERIRTYWYVIEKIDYSPYNLPSERQRIELDNIYKLLAKHEPFKQELDKLEGNNRDALIKKLLKELQQRQQTFQRRFDGWIKIQDGISSNHKAIEFRRAGAIRCNLFLNSLGQEKAVDIKLAADMITLQNIYDIAVIVSGDQDYVPAVQVLKDCGKRVVNVAFMTRRGDLLPGGARRLNQVTDWSFNIPFDVLAKHLNIIQLPLTKDDPPTTAE